MKNIALQLVLTFSICLLSLYSENLLMADNSEQDTLLAKLFEAADQRQADQELFQRALASNDKRLQKAALLSLGRIGAAETISLIGSNLYSPQPELRKYAAFGLTISGHPDAYSWISKRLANENNNEVKSELITGLGVLPKQDSDTDRIALILPYLDDDSLSVQKAACDALNFSWSMYRDSISVPNSTQVFKLLSLSQGHSELADHCLYALTRIRSEVALFDQQQLLKTIKAAQTDAHHKLLLLILTEQENDIFHDYIFEQMASSNHAVQAQAATVIAKMTLQDSLSETYEKILSHPVSQVKIGFIQGLATVAPSEQSLQWIKRLSQDKSDWVKYRSLTLLFQADPELYAKQWLAVFDNKQPSQATWEAMIMQIVAEMENDSAQTILNRATKSNHQAIRDYATSIMTEDENDDSRPDSKTLNYASVQPVFGKTLTMKTSRGEIAIQLLSAAPYSAMNFYSLAKDGYYDGVLFHRVIPNFVAQGGDPTGTGSGGPGYSIREELSLGSHTRGTVGMATAGKDTGGSQFFFNLKDNWHLDRRYTIFARVTSGLEIMDKLERGDYIISITEN